MKRFSEWDGFYLISESIDDDKLLKKLYNEFEYQSDEDEYERIEFKKIGEFEFKYHHYLEKFNHKRYCLYFDTYMSA